MYNHDIKIRVRYSETDQMSYVYYGNYAQYYEVGRVEMIRSLGLTYKDLEEKYGVLMPVMSMNVRYIRPAYYDDALKIITSVKKIPQDHIDFHVEIFNEDENIVNAAKLRLFFISKESGERIKAPLPLVEKLKPFFNNTESGNE